MRPLGLLTTATALLLGASAVHAAPPAVPLVQVAPAPVAAAPAPAPAPAAAPAGGMRTVQLAQQWAAQHGVPTRQIEVGPPERRVTRLFVPIKAEHWNDFIQAFGNQKGSILLKLDSGQHIMPIVDGKSYLWGRINPHDQYMAEKIHIGTPEAKAIVIDLQDAEYDHVHQWFAQRAAPGDGYFSQGCGSACMDFVGNIEVAPGANGVNTLRTVSPQEVANAAQGQHQTIVNGQAKVMSTSMTIPTGKKLFDLVGVARSKDGRNMTYNLVHAGNERVSVIGIPVIDAAVYQQKPVNVGGRIVVQNVQVGAGANGLERFKTMTDAELLGPLPPQGIAGVVRPDQK